MARNLTPDEHKLMLDALLRSTEMVEELPTPSPSVQPVRAWAVANKNGHFGPDDVWHDKEQAEITAKMDDRNTPIFAPHRVEEVAIVPAAVFDALEAENKALRNTLQALVDAQEHGFHPMKTTGAEWFTARALLAKGKE